MKSVPLERIAEVIRGVTFSKAEGSTIFTDGLMPVIRAGSIQKKLHLDRDLIWVPTKQIKLHQLIRKNDIIMCTSSGSSDLVGKSAISECDWDGSFGAFCAGIRANEEECNPSYLYHFLNSPAFRNWSKGSSGANIKNIRISELGRFEIPLPPLAEQQRIAAILDKADALRHKRQQAIDLADQFLRSVFLEMFGDPVTNPKGFVTKKIGDFLTVKNGYAFKSEYFTDSGEQVLLTPGNFYEKGGYKDRGSKQKYYKGPVSDGFILEGGEVLIAMTEQAEGLLGSSLIVPQDKTYLHNQRLGLLKYDEKLVSSIYLACLFNNFSIRKAIHASATGLKVRHTSPQKIESINIGCPSLEIQRKFSGIVERLNKMLAKEEAFSDDSNVFFASLSQRAFNGEL